MACISLTTLPLSCPPEGRTAGLETIYMIAYKDLAPVSEETTDKISYATNGIINEIGLVSGKKFVEVGILKNTTGFTEKGNFNPQTGTIWFTPELSLTLADLTVENAAFVKSVLFQPVALIAKTRTGSYFFTGGSGQFVVTGYEGGTGVSEGDLLGYKVTFTGTETKPLAQVDSTIIPDVI